MTPGSECIERERADANPLHFVHGVARLEKLAPQGVSAGFGRASLRTRAILASQA